MKLKLHNDWPWPASSINTTDARWVAALLPPHRALVEACGGSALMALSVSRIEIYNDCHGDVFRFFQTVRDPHSCQQLVELIESGTAPLALLAATRPGASVYSTYLFYRTCQRSWVPDLTGRWLNRRTDVRPFSGAARVLNPILDRYSNAQIEDLTPDDVIRRYDTPQTVQVVDLSLVTTDAVPAILVALKNLKGRAVVLGSTSAERDLLANWRTIVRSAGETPQTALVNFLERKRAA